MSGVGRAKLEDLGGPFLERINAYAREQGWPEATAAVGRSAPAAKAPRVVNQSYRKLESSSRRRIAVDVAEAGA